MFALRLAGCSSNTSPLQSRVRPTRNGGCTPSRASKWRGTQCTCIGKFEQENERLRGKEWVVPLPKYAGVLLK